METNNPEDVLDPPPIRVGLWHQMPFPTPTQLFKSMLRAKAQGNTALYQELYNDTAAAAIFKDYPSYGRVGRTTAPWILEHASKYPRRTDYLIVDLRIESEVTDANPLLSDYLQINPKSFKSYPVDDWPKGSSKSLSVAGDFRI
jgi:hypothetical protein